MTPAAVDSPPVARGPGACRRAAMEPRAVDRYLRLLGVSRRRPSVDALGELASAHVTRVPFENVSKVWRLRRSGLTGIPDVQEYLDGIERFRLGGTCYANNCHLHGLLVALGYRARLCGADMSRPGVHAVNVVDVDGRVLLVDAGYGAPFLAPLPLDVERDHVVALGRDRYVLHPRDAQGASALDLRRDGVRRHGYVVRPEPREVRDFREVVAASFRPDATFMNAVVFARFSTGRAVVLRNLSLVEARRDHEERRALRDREEAARVLQAVFGVPREISDEALAAIGALGADPWE